MEQILSGIDVSAWKENIDWDQAAKAVDFVILRLGFGKNNPDKQAQRNISELNRLGVPYGVYWFSYAYTEEMARNEARYALQRLREFGATLSYPVYFDWEYDSRSYAEKQGVKPTKALVRQMATAFCEEIRAAGFHPGIYTNPDYIQSFYGDEIFGEYDLWLAQYATKPSREARMWQYSSSGKVPGISGGVDMNRCCFDYPGLMDAKEEPLTPPQRIFMVQAGVFISKEEAEKTKAQLVGQGYPEAIVLEVKPA